MSAMPVTPVGNAQKFDDLRVLLEQILMLIRLHNDQLREMLAMLRNRVKTHYTVEEIAENTGRTPYTVRRWIKAGLIKADRIKEGGPRGRLLIPRSELQSVIRAGFGQELPEVTSP